MKESITRREAMKLVGAASLLALPGCATNKKSTSLANGTAAVPQRQRVARVAHLTDIHVQPERRADQGMIACLHHVQNLQDRPQHIITGGDSVMDSFDADNARTQLQWDLWCKALTNECALPVRSCIGNHDIWGWNKKKSKTTGNEPNYGKKRAMEMLRLNERYCSFDLKNKDGAAWHIIILDSIHEPLEGASGYRCLIDEQQFDWLQRDLENTGSETPVAIVSHAPIVSASVALWEKREPNGNCTVPGWLVHGDSLKITRLFAKHPNVKLCLSGHIHRLERIDYNGVAYISSGAVSGNWWQGRRDDCDEGYGVVDLYDDGGFAYEYMNYGWRAKA